jgi:hypothetical protein
VARTWLLSLGQLSNEHPAAVDLLRLCAFLAPDDIDLGLLVAGAAQVSPVLAAALSDLGRDKTVGALVGVSLVTTIPALDRLRVHRLVQAVTRDQLADHQAAEWTRRALDLITAEFPDEPQDHSSWQVCASLAPHAKSVVAHAERYPDLAAQGSRLLDQLGSYLAASAQFSAACVPRR